MEMKYGITDDENLAKDIRSHKERKKYRKKKEYKSLKSELLGWLIYILVVVVFTFVFITFVGQRTTVSGDSMYPTLHDGDSLIIDKISYRFSDPERYDIIVFPYDYEDEIYYIKRIIGLPGETIQIIDGEVYIDGELLGETYGNEVIENPGVAEYAITLGEDEYFVLGDNRNNSKDSRSSSVGIINGEDFVGKAFIRIWPFSSIGVIAHE
ncbi:MAG: signal peptidase I [Eubacteriales bacterium]